MALWEYKVITSGPHGFASPSLLEAHLNTLGKDEWEIINFQTLPNNPLAFNGLARRSTTRDWVPPEAAVVTAPKPMAWEQPPAPVSTKPSAAEEKPSLPPALAENQAPKAASETASLRTVRDTERDLDPDAPEEEEDWDKWQESQDELPTLFEAIKPHLRRNQRGPGMSVAIDYLAKRWDQKEADIVGALKECGLSLPETEEADPEYFEFEGDLYWVNRNNRGQFFLNTREKPRPTFRIAPVAKLSPDDPAAVELVAERAAEKAEIEKRNAERAERIAAQAAAAAAKAAAREQAQIAREQAHAATAAAEATAPVEGAPAAAPTGPSEPLPTGSALLDKIRPLMRRNRRGPGYSGSVAFLSRALKTTDAEFVAALAGLNLNVPANAADKPVYVEIDGGEFWINKDSRGGIWINGREKREGTPKPEVPAGEAPAQTDQPVAVVVEPAKGESVPETARPEAPAPVETALASDAPGEPSAASEARPAEDTGPAAQPEAKPAKTAKRPSRPRAPRKPRTPKK